MQNTQVSLGFPLSPTMRVERKSPLPCSKRLAVPFLKENFSPIRPRQTLQNHHALSDKDLHKAESCLSSINDPLWKQVCRDVISMMGTVSFLKIWDSTLGEVCPQDQSMEIYCQTEETTQFIQQYDFVILGSLQTYLPALKQLRAKRIPTL